MIWKDCYIDTKKYIFDVMNAGNHRCSQEIEKSSFAHVAFFSLECLSRNPCQFLVGTVTSKDFISCSRSGSKAHMRVFPSCHALRLRVESREITSYTTGTTTWHQPVIGFWNGNVAR